MKARQLTNIFCAVLTAGFLLGIHNGKIALWQDNDPEPVRIFPYSTRMLPDDAREALEKGIPVESMDDLKRLVQDYLS